MSNKNVEAKQINAFDNYILTKNIFLAHHAAKKPLLIWGSSGNGKSSAVAQWVKV
jgi:predicted AAA+ superfamily ATPase